MVTTRIPLIMVVSSFLASCSAAGLGSRLNTSGDPSAQIADSDLTIDGITSYVATHGITTIEDLLDHLPQALRGNYVLMETSRSRQNVATAASPRIIMFLPTGRLYMGIATDSASNGYNDAEMLEYDEGQGFRMQALSFNPASGAGPTTITSDSCGGCHGPSLRPIWGSYPDWPGAFEPNHDSYLTPTQAQTLTSVLADPSHANPRLAKLSFETTTFSAGSAFELPFRVRPFANEGLDDAIAGMASKNIYRQAQTHGNYRKLLYQTIAEDACQGSLSDDFVTALNAYLDNAWTAGGITGYADTTRTDKAYLLLGLDPFNDFGVPCKLPDLVAANPTCNIQALNGDRTQDYYFDSMWNSATTRMGGLIEIQLVNDLVARAPAQGIDLEGTFRSSAAPTSDIENTYTDLDDFRLKGSNDLWNVALDDKLAHLTTASEYSGDLSPSLLFSAEWKAKACSQLEQLGRAELAAPDDPAGSSGSVVTQPSVTPTPPSTPTLSTPSPPTVSFTPPTFLSPLPTPPP